MVVALLLAQWLGLVHGIVHADHAGHMGHVGPGGHVDPSEGHDHGGPRAHQIEPGEPASVADAERLSPLPSFSVQALIGDHDDEGQCRLYDQLGHADLIVAWPVLLAPSPLPQCVLPHHGAWHLAVQATGFLARGPPVRG